MNAKAYGLITDRIISLLEKGTIPWQKPWSVRTQMPRNLISKRPYRGINVFLLVASSYESPLWLTFRQATQLGGSVKKGEKACPVIFWKAQEPKDPDKERKAPLLQHYHVFNVAQCDGLSKATPEMAQQPEPSPAKPDEVLVGMPNPPTVKHGMTCAFYSPQDDTIGLPRRKAFNKPAEYHAALFHELVHSTGHEKRLNRPTLTAKQGFGSDPYCKEELIAELGATFLCAHAEIVDRTIENSAAYLQGWLKRLRSDNTLMIHAAAQAQRATDLILNHSVKDNTEGSPGDTSNKVTTP